MTNQVHFLTSAQHQQILLIQKNMFVRNTVRELHFMKASVLSLTFTFQHFHSLLESVVKCQPGFMKARKIINYKKNCLSNEDQYKSSYWGKQLNAKAFKCRQRGEVFVFREHEQWQGEGAHFLPWISLHEERCDLLGDR